VKQYDLRLRSGKNCYDQEKLLNFSMAIKEIPRLKKRPDKTYELYWREENIFEFGAFSPK